MVGVELELVMELVMMDCPDVVCEVMLNPLVLPVWLEDTGAVVVLTVSEV